MKKIKVTYDYDDVLTDLNGACAKKLNYDINLLNKFEIKYTKLPKDIQAKLLNEYMNVEIYKEADWFDGIDQVLEISKNNCVDFKVHSHIMTDVIGDYKKKRLIDKGFKEENLNMQLGKIKEMQDTDIIVEDSLVNLIKSPAKYKILIDKAWNKKENYPEYTKEYDNILIVKDLIHANRMVEDIIKIWITKHFN